MKPLKAGIHSWFSKAFNLPALQKSRLPWVDYLRGIAIILVVYRHTLLGIERSGISIPAFLVNANMIFYSFRMPLFFIVSGIFIGGTLARKSLNQVILIKFENLLYPYLVWSFIQITLQIILAKYVNAERGLVDYTYILYQPRDLDQFWYLPALFNATVIYILIKTKLRPPGWAQLVFGLLLYFLSSYVSKISMLSDWMEFYLFFALGDTISGLFFQESSQKFLKKPFLLLLMIPLFAVVQLLYLKNPEEFYRNDWLGQVEFLGIAFTGCFTMFLLALRLQHWNTLRFLRVLGFHSLYIYAMHVLVLGFMRILLTRFGGIDNPYILLFCGIVTGVTIPVICYNLLIRNHAGWFLFSFRRKKPATTLAQEVKNENAAM